MEQVTALEHDRERLGRSSTAEKVADILRERIAEGFFTPGERLSEMEIGKALGVSRNTLREAFRLLSHERLLTHRLNRGVFVRVLSAEDVSDLYRVRRVIEGAAVRRATPEGLAALREALAEGDRAVRESRWRDVGTANLRFHQALAKMNGSKRLDDLMRQLLAELRLVFHVMIDPRLFHGPFVPRNKDLVALLEAGDYDRAERELDIYLDDAEAMLIEAFGRARAGGA
ncbi:GntR family transcriptional regulator [Spongiactinospora gelatinilytica]|uniref:GntR family transcriptional regulator n=1 Tax=Spongiactinospora gelatinilytica TaxID=2666298 RepID=A0A2W2I4F0_9ACTN|nr:GntR family transcriptional regulator [Spongiactinospora gelatinilytica]PZG45424.1 GntR family transcriptional regulator [Spongiactinospora gelatinilytica]